MHFNDLILEPLKKISFKLKLAKKKRWYYGNDIRLTPGVDVYQLLKKQIEAPDPQMIARFGSTEMSCIVAYIVGKSERSFFNKTLRYLSGEIPAFWFGHKNMKEICSNSGFFPQEKELIVKFCERMLTDAKELDVLMSWMNGEKYIFPFLPENCKQISLWDIEPFFQKHPWTMFLEGKKVLVIHPFANTIAKQYLNRKNIFPDKQILPDMELTTFKAVQTIANNKVPFNTWFDALDYMENEIDKIDFDIALIAAGAYGLPLAAHIKRSGKKAIHIGGSLQLYFGIIGLRWEQMPQFKSIMNEHWVRPLPGEYPEGFRRVEGGVYW